MTCPRLSAPVNESCLPRYCALLMAFIAANRSAPCIQMSKVKPRILCAATSKYNKNNSSWRNQGSVKATIEMKE